MKIKIKSAIHGKFVELEVLHIYSPHSQQLNRYRRYAPDHWCHLLGKHGWHRYLTPEILEETYQDWERNAKKTTNL